MIVIASLVVLLFLLWGTWQRLGILSPATFGLSFVVLNLGLFSLHVTFPGIFDGARGVSFQLDDSYASTLETVIAYSIIGVAIYLGGIGLKTTLRGTEVGTTINRALTDSIAAGLAIALLGASLAHLAAVDHALLWHSRFYLQLATAQGAGIESSVIGLIHLIIGPIGLLATGACVIMARRRQYAITAMYAAVVVYTLTISLAQSSRWAPMIVLGLALTELAGARNNWTGRRLMLRLTMASTVLVTYMMVLNGRASGNLGLAWLADNLMAIDSSSFATSAQTFILNIGHGCLLFAEIVDHGARDYDLGYMLLSFSPAPSFIDGWREVAGSQNRINLFTPYSAIAETWLFGPAFFAAFAFYVFAISAIATRFAKSGRISDIALLGPIYFVMLAIHFYPLRNSFRVAVVVLLLALLLRYAPRLRLRWR